MKAKHRFILAVIILGLLMTGPFLVTSLLVWLDMKESERQMLTELLLSRLPVGTMMTLFGFALGVLVLHKLFKQYVEGLLRMAETLRLMLGANRDFRVTPEEMAGIRGALARQHEVDWTFQIDIKDADGVVHTVVERTVYIAEKNYYRLKSGGDNT